MEALLPVLLQVFLIVLLGCFLRSRGLFSDQAGQEISSFVVNISCPLLVIASVVHMKSAAPGTVLNWLLTGMVIYAILPFLAWLLTLLLHPVRGEQHMYQFMFIFSNTSLLGFPVVQSLFGDDAIFYTALLHLPFDVLVYSYGIWLMCGAGQPFSWHRLWNPGLVLTLLALVLYFFPCPLPGFLVDFCTCTGSVTTPLSMLVIGAALQKAALGQILKIWRLFLLSVIRLVGLPLIIYFLLLHLTIFDYWLLGIATVTFGMPVGSMAVMMAVEYHNNEQLAAQAVSLTTAGLLVSLPLLIFMIGVP